MDRVTTLTETVRSIVSSYATRGYNGNGEPSKFYYVENIQENIFSVVGPYDPAVKHAHLILMVRIINDQIIIDQDKTSVSVRDELKSAGIPEHQISLAWNRK
jgi:hypothetical protein